MSEGTATSSFLGWTGTALQWAGCSTVDLGGSPMLCDYIVYHSNLILVRVDDTMVLKIPCTATGGGCFFPRQLDSIPLNNIVVVAAAYTSFSSSSLPLLQSWYMLHFLLFLFRLVFFLLLPRFQCFFLPRGKKYLLKEYRHGRGHPLLKTTCFEWAKPIKVIFNMPFSLSVQTSSSFILRCQRGYPSRVKRWLNTHSLSSVFFS